MIECDTFVLIVLSCIHRYYMPCVYTLHLIDMITYKSKISVDHCIFPGLLITEKRLINDYTILLSK